MKLHRKVLKNALCDTGELNVPVVCPYFPFYGLTVGWTASFEVLIAGSALDGYHILHPKMIGIRPQRIDRLLEADLDLES